MKTMSFKAGNDYFRQTLRYIPVLLISVNLRCEPDIEDRNFRESKNFPCMYHRIMAPIGCHSEAADNFACMYHRIMAPIGCHSEEADTEVYHLARKKSADEESFVFSRTGCLFAFLHSKSYLIIDVGLCRRFFLNLR